MTTYKQMNGTSYHEETPDTLCRLLETLRESNARVRFHWGDTETGRDWGDQYDVAGRIGRSCGPVKIPILVHNSRSMGGTGILDHCIVRIQHANKRDGGDIYKHPEYHQ